MRTIRLLTRCGMLVVAALSSLSAAQLAPEASYSVTISGFAYRGQIVPGTNAPNTVDGYVPAPPWQGPPATLTDGRRDSPAVESWFWSNMDKRITVTFDLRRPAAVSAVRVWTKAEAGHSYGRASVRVAASPEALEQAQDVTMELVAEGAQWRGAPLSGRFMRLVCDSGAPTISLSEVEIEGEVVGAIAAGAPPAGLLSVPPRDLTPLLQLPPRAEDVVNIVPRPEVRLTVSARHHDHMTGAWVDDQPGDARALRDGDMTTTMASFTDWYAHKTMTLQFDLHGDYQVDRVIVWSADHDGPPRSYVNAYRLWLQPGAGAPWLPAGETRNSVLPGEMPPAPYPIVSAALDRPAAALRLQLQGASQSADVMRVAEIEIWARPLATPAVVKPMRIKAPVPAIAPVAIGTLSPAYDWIEQRRLRGLYTYVGRSEETEILTRAMDAGFNALIVHTMGNSHSEQGWPEEAARWVEVQQRYRLQVIISWPFGSDERFGNTMFGAYQPGGATEWKKTPCPLSTEYWQRVVGDRAVIAAQDGLTGMVVDMEMYGADSTRYRGPCCCDRCWATFVEGHLDGVSATDVTLADRPTWLEANDLLADYARSQELQVMAILRDIERRVHEVNPDFLLGNLLDFESLPGLARGFGTPTMPALIFSETEYGGNLNGLEKRLARLTEQGYPALYVPGFFPNPMSPEQLEKLIPQASLPSAGFWVWSRLAYDDNAPAGYGHAEGHTAEEYWEATRRGTDTLDAAPKARP